MGKPLEIKWHGRSGYEVASAAATLAEVLAHEGKYVQAFSEFNIEKIGAPVIAFNRISDLPIRLHSCVKDADIVVVFDPRLYLYIDVKINAKDDAIYIINTSSNSELIKEKINLKNNKVYTLDADSIALKEIGKAIPDIPMMSIVINSVNLISIENFKRGLEKFLSSKINHDMSISYIKTIDRALNEVKTL